MNLRPYQEEATTFLYEHDRAMVLAPVGAGKTALTLTAMRESQRVIAQHARAGERRVSRAENYNFHFRLYELAERPQTLQFVRVLWARYPFVTQERGGARLKNIEEHERFLMLIEAGDRAGAVEAMVAHIESGWNDLMAGKAR